MAKKRTAAKPIPAAPSAGADICLIDVTIEGDPPLYVARTPHVPSLQAYGQTDAGAIAGILEQVRDYRRPFERQDQPVPWIEVEAGKAGKDTDRRHIKGLRPAKSIEPAAGASPAGK